MLMALRFEPSRFFLKGKVRQKIQATSINTLQEKKLVRCEMNTKEDIKSRVYGPGSGISIKRRKKAESGTGPGTGQKEIKYEYRYQEFWLEEEIMRLVKSNESERGCKTKPIIIPTSKTHVEQM